MTDLRTALPALLPRAITWARETARRVELAGAAINSDEVLIARKVGVRQPHLIRVLEVDVFPLPEEAELRDAALRTGLLGPEMVGLTLGCSVLVCRGYRTRRLLSHEFRHVYQYESAGSIAAFLPLYLQQIVEVGYANAPLEIDARAHEFD